MIDRRPKPGIRNLSSGSRTSAAMPGPASKVGEPSETIGRAGQEGYSLIIVGKHGKNWIEGKIIGSTAAKVCETARRPVLMVPLQKE
jgi:hypothetical protein